MRISVYWYLFLRQKVIHWRLDEVQQEDQARLGKCQTRRDFPKLIDNSWSHILPICVPLFQSTHVIEKEKENKRKENTHWTFLMSHSCPVFLSLHGHLECELSLPSRHNRCWVKKDLKGTLECWVVVLRKEWQTISIIQFILICLWKSM